MSPKLPQLKAKDVHKILLKANFALFRQKGSHAHYKHSKNQSWVTVPVHSKPLKKGTLRNIIRQSGLSVEEFLRLR